MIIKPDLLQWSSKSIKQIHHQRQKKKCIYKTKRKGIQLSIILFCFGERKWANTTLKKKIH